MQRKNAPFVLAVSWPREVANALRRPPSPRPPSPAHHLPTNPRPGFSPKFVAEDVVEPTPTMTAAPTEDSMTSFSFDFFSDDDMVPWDDDYAGKFLGRRYIEEWRHTRTPVLPVSSLALPAFCSGKRQCPTDAVELRLLDFVWLLLFIRAAVTGREAFGVFGSTSTTPSAMPSHASP